MSSSQPDSSYNKAVADFLDGLHQSSIIGINCHSDLPAKFFPTSLLKERLTRPVVASLLDALFPNSQPPDATSVLKKCLKVFCILLRIGHGGWIHEFLMFGAWDEKLPFSDPVGKWPPSAKRIFPAFKEEQWAFAIPALETIQDYRFESEEILPIVDKVQIDEGGCAKIFKISVHPDFDRLDDPENNEFMDSSFPNVYVLKTYYGTDQKDNYESEITAYENVRRASSPHNKGITTYYGSFRQGDTFSIILEYADGQSLERHFESEHAPRHSLECLRFYRALFTNTLEGLVSIHQQMNQTGQHFNGIHQDVKPPNILYVSGNKEERFSGTYKLSDPGLSQFDHPARPGQQFHDRGGTKTYGPPECYRPDSASHYWHIPVSKKADIWSLGCVFHEAITWATLGRDALIQYRRSRALETQMIPGFRDGNCFHNGSRRLDVVDNVTQRIRTAILTQGERSITLELLQLTCRMMEVDSSSRPTSVELCMSLVQLMKAAEVTFKRLESSPNELDPVIPPGLPPYRVSSSSPINDEAAFPQTEGYGLAINSTARPASDNMYRRFDADEANAHSNQVGVLPIRSATLSHHIDHNRTNSFGLYQENTHRSLIGSQNTEVPHGHLRHSATFDQPTVRGKLPAAPRTAFSRHDFGERQEHSRTSLYQNPVIGQAHSPYTNSPERIENDMPSASFGQQHHSGHEKKSSKTIPKLAVTMASSWRENCKYNKMRRKLGGEDEPLPYGYLRKDLDHRDHVFIVDDSRMMVEHWAEAMKLLDILMYLVKRTDKNGMELLFTTTEQTHTSTNTSTLIRVLEGKKGRIYQNNEKCDMEAMLSTTLGQYQRKLVQVGTQRHKDLKPLNLYILTTGEWQDECDPGAPIKSVAEVLDDHGFPQAQLGIQFIRFGDSQVGKALLASLDEDLQGNGVGKKKLRDIVDTEPSNGNVWKMLFGGTDKRFDAA